jgi:urease accessory protein
MRDIAPYPVLNAPTLPVELMLWLSPAFPVGAFAYSHGLEYASAHLGVTHLDALSDWIACIARHGSLRNDLVLITEAWQACNGERWSRLTDCNDLALASQPSAERYLETTAQGDAFAIAVAASWPAAGFATAVRACQFENCGPIAYPVVVAAAAATHAIPLDAVLLGYASAFVANLASAAIRLSIIGQTDGQRLIAALMPELVDLARAAVNFTLDDLGSATFAADLASMAHETQYTRLFRS